MNIKTKNKNAFTLIELLVVIAIIGILIGLSFFGLQGARQSSRDAKRKSDLETIRSGLEIYKADCNSYPISWGGSIPGMIGLHQSLTGSCPTMTTYISKMPVDPLPSTNNYVYSSDDGITYTLCAALEQPPSSPDITGCGSCTVPCNYKVTNP